VSAVGQVRFPGSGPVVSRCHPSLVMKPASRQAPAGAWTITWALEAGKARAVCQGVWTGSDGPGAAGRNVTSKPATRPTLAAIDMSTIERRRRRTRERDRCPEAERRRSPSGDTSDALTGRIDGSSCSAAAAAIAARARTQASVDGSGSSPRKRRSNSISSVMFVPF